MSPTQFLTSLITLTLLTVATSQADLQSHINTQTTTATKTLTQFHGPLPAKGTRTLRVVYWTPNDRQPAANYQQRLTRIILHIQKFYADEMERLGLGRRTFNLKQDHAAPKLLKIHTITGKGPYADYGMQSGGQIRQECVPALKEAGIDADRETLLLFCNMAKWDPEKRRFKHNSPYYAGGSHQSGTAWQLDSPILDTTNLAKKEPKMHDGQYGHISIGKHNSIFIGGIAHELGHALGLPHNKERPDERAAFGTALMGSGNRSYGDELRGEGKGSFLTLAHGLRLASHPLFSNSTKGMTRPVRNDITNVAFKTQDNKFHVTGNVTGTPAVYAIVAYMDPEGGSDYNATTATAIPNPDGSFAIQCGSDALQGGKPAQLRLFALHVNGAVSGRMSNSRYKWPMTVNADRTLDLTALERQKQLAPVIQALNSGQKGDIQKALAALAKTNAPAQTKRIAQRITSTHPAPAEDAKTIALTDLKPASAKVGWLRPTYDRLPAKEALLTAGGTVYEHGIYAHAPARHTYTLDKNWKTLKGQAGVATGHRGTVLFIIKGDGQELYRSKPTKAGKPRPYNIDVSKITTLELIVEESNDGTGSDWALWLHPTLSR